MSHPIYQTTGFVVKGVNNGESNKTFHLLTPDLGLIIGHAQAVRELKSKLRYHLQEATLLSLGLVRGKDIWRIVHAEKLALFAPLEKYA